MAALNKRHAETSVRE